MKRGLVLLPPLLVAGIATATTALPCVEEGHTIAPIFSKPTLDLGSGAYGASAEWKDGTGDPSVEEVDAGPNDEVDFFWMEPADGSIFVAIRNHNGHLESLGHDGQHWTPLDYFAGCSKLRVCWTVTSYVAVKPSRAKGHVSAKGVVPVGGYPVVVEGGAEFPLWPQGPPKFKKVDTSFCEEYEVCPC
jgi:hypothetical protein